MARILDAPVQFLTADPDHGWTEDDITPALDLLRKAEPVILPTETVYGLAADATSDKAVSRIYSVKGRPPNNPLICHVADFKMAQQIGVFSQKMRLLARQFWPGPLTLVVPLRPDAGISASVTAGLDSVAIRCPAKKIFRMVIAGLGRPLAAPSANLSGKLSPTSAIAAANSLQDRVKLVVDDGPASHGIESTIVHERDGTLEILRPGSIDRATLSRASGTEVIGSNAKAHEQPDVLMAPGQMTSHYAPDMPVNLNVTSKIEGHVFVGFGDIGGDISLSSSGDLSEAARRFYDVLTEADTMAGNAIDVAPIPVDGIGEAINDRLARAAAPRSKG